MSARGPLSGDVTQAINPWSWWLGSLSQQTGFININTVRSGDPALERRIIEEVASYGRQLGWIVEALEVLIARAGTDGLDVVQRGALEQIGELARRIEALKGGPRSGGVLRADLERALEEVRALEARDPRAYREIVARVREAFPSG
jgi:hypothetical protein